jgi:flagellin-specific chaperone FliS
MAKTTAELLDEVEAAISKALEAQAYSTTAGNSKTNADLGRLFEIRDRLKMQLDAESSTNASATRLLATFNHSNG